MLRFFLYIGIAFACFVGILVALIGSVLLSTPRPDDIKSCITAKMYNVPLCPTDKNYVKLKQISPYIRHAVIVSEDSSFYGHKGIDFHELKLSFEENLKEGRIVRGGSTITQQLAKNVYLSAEKSIFRKAREAVIALQLEKILTKDEILEKYLNVVEFGPDVYGVRKATQFYFGKGPGQVSVLEGAWLAFVLPNPKKYSQSFRKRQLTKFARSQLRVIVERMARFGKISQDEAQVALNQLERMFKPIDDPTEDEMLLEQAEAEEHALPPSEEPDRFGSDPIEAPPEDVEEAVDPDVDESESI